MRRDPLGGLRRRRSLPYDAPPSVSPLLDSQRRAFDSAELERRLARVLETEPPYDPRRNLDPEAVRLADPVLEEMAEEEPKRWPPSSRHGSRRRSGRGSSPGSSTRRGSATWRRGEGGVPLAGVPSHAGWVRAFVLRLLGVEEAAPAEP
jgi:hypothetical protein